MYVLNYTERYINFLAAFITVLIFVALLILDIHIFKIQNNKYQKNTMSSVYIYKTYIKLSNNKNNYEISDNYVVNTKNIYTYISKKVSSDDKSKIVAKEENRIAKDNKNEKQMNTNLDKKNSESASINIYLTNKWRIKIPKLNIDDPISEGTSQEALRRTVGHFSQTDKWNGNVALAGHNRGYKCNFFQEIKKLQKDDLIIYSTEKGKRTYKVTMNKVIKETDWSYIQNTKDNRITLITCEANRRAYRRCIQAIELL